MNLSTLALIFLAWQLLSNGANTPKKPSSRPQVGIADFLNDDTKNMLDCVSKLTSSSDSQEKTGALFQMMANPAVMNLATNLFGGAPQGGTETSDKTDVHTQHQTHTEEFVNQEGYRFETPSASSQEFFRPIDNSADAEIKHKLYLFFDNWYVK